MVPTWFLSVALAVSLICCLLGEWDELWISLLCEVLLLLMRFFATMGFHKSTIVARDANTQLDPSFVSAPQATNVDLFAYFAERLFISSSISYSPCRRVPSDSLYVGMPYVWSVDRTACCSVVNRQNYQNNAILALNSIERPATFHRV